MNKLSAPPWEQVITEAIAILDRHGELHMITKDYSDLINIKSSHDIYNLAVEHGTTSDIIYAAISKKEIEKTEPDLEGDLKRQDTQLRQVAVDLERWTSRERDLPPWVHREMTTLLIEIRTLRELTGRTR